jgi:hypothetical protein
MKLLEKSIVGTGGLAIALLDRGGFVGMLQGQLADLLGISYTNLSMIVAGMGLERQTLGRAEAKFLKDQGLIHPQSRGGNFLPINTMLQVLRAIRSEAARAIEAQLQQCRLRRDDKQEGVITFGI